MENIFFLALLAVVGLLRWWSQAAEDRRNKEAERHTGDPAPNVTIPRAPVSSEEERIRKFMEALGVPTATTTAPPPAHPQAETTPQPPWRKPPLMPVDPFPQPRPIIPRVFAPAPAPPTMKPPAPAATPPVSQMEPPPLPPTIEPRRRSATRRASLEPDAYAIDQQTIDEDVSSSRPEPATARGAVVGSLATRLATPQGLRDAMVLREILGPPRSMQPLESSRAS